MIGKISLDLARKSITLRGVTILSRTLSSVVQNPNSFTEKLPQTSSRNFSSLTRLSSTNLLHQSDIFASIKRYKKTKARKNSADDEENNKDDDDDDEEEDEENPLLVDDVLENLKEGVESNMVLDIGTLRLDGFATKAFSMARTKVEEAFYKGDIYINGERATKKSQDLSLGDEIDIIKQTNVDDHNMVDIKRAQIVKLPDKTNEQGRMKVTINRWLNMTIENPGKNQDDED